MSAVIKFTKMHGLGNDFVVINGISQKINLTKNMTQFIANRHTGIGCDQILVVEKSDDKNIDFNYRIYNSDGSEIGQCGNGARCLAKFIHDEKLSDKKILKVKTFSALLELDIKSDQEICVNMGVPKDIDKIQVEGLSGLSLDLGNPHVVFKVDDLRTPISNLGLGDVNVGFMKVLDRNTLQLRVFERGAGETLACGSGACAAVVAGITQKLLDHDVTVELKGGKLSIQWKGDNHPVMMTGPAVTVFKGEIEVR